MHLFKFYSYYLVLCLFVFSYLDKNHAYEFRHLLEPKLHFYTTMKELNLKFVVLFLFCLGSAFTNKVAKVEVMTSKCEDCGMGPFGSLSIRVLI